MMNTALPKMAARPLWLTLALVGGAMLGACGRDQPAQSAQARPRLNACDYGMRIYFGIGGDAQRIQHGGWAGTERFFTWSDGAKATLAIRLPSNEHDVRLRFKVAAFVAPPELPSQPIDVLVNGEQLARWEVAGPQTFSVIVPARLLELPKALTVRPTFVPEPGWLAVIDFLIPKAVSPKQVGHSDDPRLLGLQMQELHITKVKKAQPPASAP